MRVGGDGGGCVRRRICKWGLLLLLLLLVGMVGVVWQHLDAIWQQNMKIYFG